MESGAIWLPWVSAILATWRLSRLVAFEDGPGGVVVRVRTWAGRGWLGELMDCPYCLTIWFAAPTALAVDATMPGWILAWLGVSGGASLVQELVGERRSRATGDVGGASPRSHESFMGTRMADGPPPVPIERTAGEAEEKSDVLLWEPTRRREPGADNVRPRPLGVPRPD